jgi:hypothetical protein
LGITIHYFAGNHEYKNRTLTVKHLIGNSTTNNYTNAVLDVIHKWNICSKLIGIVTDNAANMRSIGANISNKVCSDGGLHSTFYSY